MPETIPAGQLGQAVLDYVHDGSYPDTEQIISAELSASAFPTLLGQFDAARQEAKVRFASSHDNGSTYRGLTVKCAERDQNNQPGPGW
jgi:centromere/kinetochore protein ZW10